MQGNGQVEPVLVERAPALRALADALEAASQGSGSTVLVYGEAGIGKTTLLRTALGPAPTLRGWRVLWGGCEALFSPRPLGPLFDMAPELGERLRGLLVREGQRSELFAALLELLRQAPEPLALVFEDVHWADAATLDCIKFLGRRLAGLRTLLVLSYRDDELGERHPLRAVLGDLPAAQVRRIPLDALSEEGVAELARRHGVQRQGLFAATQGNPFFVTESLHSPGLPSTVRDAVLARASRLPPSVRSLLDLAAIVPSRVEGWLLQAVATPPAEDLAVALNSGLLQAQGDCFAFRHELARLALEQALAAPLAAQLHARVLAALESTGAAGVPPARLVHHAARAGQHAAVQRLAPMAAARAAELGAHREAAALYAAALEASTGLSAQERAELLDKRSYQCYLVGQIEDAVAPREAALGLWRQVGDRTCEARTLRWLSRLNWFLGRNAEAVTFAEEAVALLKDQPPSEELAWVMSNRAQLHMLAEEVDLAVQWGTRAADMAERLGAVEVQAHALNNTGAAQYTRRPPAGREQLERSLHLALKHDLREHVARAYVNLIAAEITHGHHALARQHLEAATAYLSARNLDAWSHYLAAWTCRLDLETGRWAEAAEGARQVLSRPQVAPVSRLPTLIVLARLRMRRGDPGAGELLQEATALARRTGEFQRLAPLAVAHAEAAWLGLPQADVPLANELLVAARARQAPAASEIAFWLGLAGAGQAGSEWTEPDRPFEQAVALFHAGGEAHMQAALGQLAALGCEATVARLHVRLREQGIRLPEPVIRGPRATTAAHPVGLTQREAQVLALIAQGLTNAEIAARLVRSAKTVDHHVSAILAKLNARSRAEASALAARLGLLDAGQSGEVPRQSG